MYLILCGSASLRAIIFTQRRRASEFVKGVNAYFASSFI